MEALRRHALPGSLQIMDDSHNWLMVWNMAFMTFHSVGNEKSSQLMFMIFQMGRYTTNQIKFHPISPPQIFMSNEMTHERTILEIREHTLWQTNTTMATMENPAIVFDG